MKISRRNFLTKVVVGVAGLPLMRDFAWAQAKGKLGYMKIVDNAAMFVAMDKGFFKAEGLELETVPMAGGAVIVQGVTSGDLQFGWTNVISLYQAFVEGFDFKLIAGGATNVRGSNETHAIVVGKDSPIKTAKDLEGKTVAVNTLNNIVHLMALAWVDKNGGNSSKVKFVEIPFPEHGSGADRRQGRRNQHSGAFCGSGGAQTGNPCPIEPLGRCLAEVFDRQLVRVG